MTPVGPRGPAEPTEPTREAGAGSGTDAVEPAVRLAEALGVATRPDSLTAELTLTVARTRAVFGAAACSFAAVEPSGETLRFLAADGAGADRIRDVVVPVGRGIVGWVAMSQDAIAVADVARDTRFARDVAESSGYVPSAILAAPVVDADGETVGVLEVLDARAEPARDTQQDLAVLGLVAAQLATTVRLSATFDTLADGLLRSLTAADPAFRAGPTSHLASSGAEPGASLVDTAEAFRRLAGRGPAAARLATRILADVADYTTAGVGRGRP